MIWLQLIAGLVWVALRNGAGDDVRSSRAAFNGWNNQRKQTDGRDRRQKGLGRGGGDARRLAATPSVDADRSSSDHGRAQCRRFRHHRSNFFTQKKTNKHTANLVKHGSTNDSSIISRHFQVIQGSTPFLAEPETEIFLSFPSLIQH